MNGFHPAKIMIKSILGKKVFGKQGLNNDHSNDIFLYGSILSSVNSNQTSHFLDIQSFIFFFLKYES